MNNAISVVIPLYNGARFIETTLASVLKQTLTPKEIIVVDDGSTDNGPALVTAMANGYPITLLSKANGGQSAARNFGIAHSTGEWIALLDQDDIWYPQHLEGLLKPFADNGSRQIGWTYSEVDEIDLQGNMVTQCYLRTLPGEHPKRDIFECLRGNMYVVPSAALILRRAFDAVGGFDERFCGYEDDDLFLRIFRAGYDNVFLDTALTKWRVHPESSTFTTSSMRKSRALFLRKWWDEFPDDPRRGRFVRRDFLLPRAYIDALREYTSALQSGDATDIAETREELLFIVNHMPGLKHKLFGYLLTGMRSPFVMQTVMALRPFLRPIVRFFI